MSSSSRENRSHNGFFFCRRTNEIGIDDVSKAKIEILLKENERLKDELKLTKKHVRIVEEQLLQSTLALEEINDKLLQSKKDREMVWDKLNELEQSKITQYIVNGSIEADEIVVKRSALYKLQDVIRKTRKRLQIASADCCEFISMIDESIEDIKTAEWDMLQQRRQSTSNSIS